MTAVAVETPGTVTPWAVAHWLTEGPGQRAVVIVPAAPPDAHIRQALEAEHRDHQARTT